MADPKDGIPKVTEEDVRSEVLGWADAIRELVAINAPAEKIMGHAAMLNSTAARLLNWS